MMTKPFAEADRAQLSFLAPIEKRCLIWLAQRAPWWMNSDHLTGLGLLALLAAGICYWYSRWNTVALLLVIVCLAANWAGDSLDGTLARVRNKQRPRYGFYVDHIVDCLGALFLLGGLGLSSFMSPGIALGLLIAYLLLSCEVYLATYTLGKFEISFWKFSPTELRILLAAGNIALFLNPRAGMSLLGERYSMLDIGGAIGIVGMGLVLAISVIKHTRTLYQAEPVR
jgi:sn-1,2-diacylglycerol ethanolamine- and cholinephosphotranferases